MKVSLKMNCGKVKIDEFLKKLMSLKGLLRKKYWNCAVVELE